MVALPVKGKDCSQDISWDVLETYSGWVPVTCCCLGGDGCVNNFCVGW